MRHFMSYIDDAFLEDFFNQKPTDIESTGDELDIWRDWLRFVRDKTDIDLTIKVKIEDLAYNINSTLTKQLIDDYYQGKQHISLNTDKLENSTARDLVTNSEKPTFIFRIDLPNNEITEEKTGFCCINGVSFFDKWRFLTQIETKLITKQVTPIRMRSWSELSVWKHPINAIIVCDNYVLGNVHHIDNNLLPLLTELMPNQNLAVPIDILIISSEFYKNDVTGIPVTAIEVNQKIFQFLRRINITDFNLTISKVNDKRLIHSRDIFTNYLELCSDHSFSYFYRNGNIAVPADTTLTKKPSVNADNIEKRKIRLSTIKQLVDNSIEYCGSKNNRLFK